MSSISEILKNLYDELKSPVHYHIPFTAEPRYNRIICFNDLFCNIGVTQNPLIWTNHIDDIGIRQRNRHEYDVVTFFVRRMLIYLFYLNYFYP